MARSHGWPLMAVFSDSLAQISAAPQTVKHTQGCAMCFGLLSVGQVGSHR